MIIYKHAQTLNIFRMLMDLIAIACAWLLSYFLRFHAELIPLEKGTDTLDRYLILAPLLLLSYSFTFLNINVYKRALEKRRIWEEHFELLRAHTLAFFVFVTLAYFVYEHRYSRITLAIFFILTPILLPLGRSLIRKASRAYLRGRKATYRALVIGSSERAKELAVLIRERKEWDTELVDIVPVEEVATIRRYLTEDSVNVAFVAANSQESIHVSELLKSVGNTVAELLLFPDLGTNVYLEPKLIVVDRFPAVALNTSALNSVGNVVKRCYDFSFALMFLIVFSPVYFLVALLVKASSPGPILYRQERMGLDGKTFQCLKFRGMYVDAESKTGPVWAKANDDRTTPVGRWLRKTSLDEIPQFINVLKGEMSVVGPRPERPVFVQSFRDHIPGYMLRHKTKCGITGWAQINGWRGNTSLEKRIECDLWYIQNWSIWLDIKICLLTPLKGFIHPNAY